MLKPYINRLRFFGFNRSIIYSFLGKGWLLISGLVTSLLIASYFSPELQGYYYAFNSLLVLTVFAELGLTSVLINFVSHEWLHIRIGKDGAPFGVENSISRLTSLCYFSIRWFACAAILITTILIVFGWFFWSDAKQTDIKWQLPWIALSLVTGLNLISLPVSAVLEGCNQVKNLYKYRLIQYLISSIIVWFAIPFGAGLWVASFSIFSGLLVMLILCWINYRALLKEFFLKKPRLGRVNWQLDILPMQWRIALSWIGGYFTFALFVPVLFHYHGAVLAGQMGMTWAFIGALMSISSAWISPHSPSLGILVASKKYLRLDQRFKNIFIVNTCLMVLGSLSLVAAIALLNYISPNLGTRLLPLDITIIFLIGTIIYTMGLPIAIYLRAHKQEPLTKISILGGILNGAMVIILGMKYGAMGIAIAYASITIIMLPFLIKILSRKRREWH